MRTSWLLSCWLGAVLLALGCRNTGPELKPLNTEEEYNLPPCKDPRYDSPPAYTPSPDPNNPDGSGKRGGGLGGMKGGGMGGMGGGMGGGGMGGSGRSY